MKLPNLDPFNSFLHRGSLKSVPHPSFSSSNTLKDWKITAKDNLSVKDWPLTCASRILDGNIASYNADVIESVLGLGGEIVGKVNMDEFGMGSRGERSCFGPALNPLDTGRSAGGSSGGSSAAVSGGLCRLSIGSDTGGSVRLPASYTGIVGYKPTWGLISRYGLVSYAPSLDTIGLMTRSVGDIITCFEGIIGSRHNWRDPTMVKMNNNERSAMEPLPLEGITIGVLKEWLKDLSGISNHPLEQILNSLENKSGARLKLVSIPELNGSECLERYYEIACMEASSTLSRFTGTFLKKPKEGEPFLIIKDDLYNNNKNNYENVVRRYQEENLGAEVFRRIERGRNLLCDSGNLARSENYRRNLRKSFSKIFKEECCDVLIGPTAFSPAPMLSGHFPSEKEEKEDDLFTVPANLSGLPAISLPLHHLRAEGIDGVIGTQLMSDHLDDRLLLRISRELEAFIIK